jgi:hypothetical protein
MTPRNHENLLTSLYEKTPQALDKLPYTESFESLSQRFVDETGSHLDRASVWQILTNRRKRGELPKKGRQPR